MKKRIDGRIVMVSLFLGAALLVNWFFRSVDAILRGKEWGCILLASGLPFLLFIVVKINSLVRKAEATSAIEFVFQSFFPFFLWAVSIPLIIIACVLLPA